jgi:hypothetical protein
VSRSANFVGILDKDTADWREDSTGSASVHAGSSAGAVVSTVAGGVLTLVPADAPKNEDSTGSASAHAGSSAGAVASAVAGGVLALARAAAPKNEAFLKASFARLAFFKAGSFFSASSRSLWSVL